MITLHKIELVNKPNGFSLLRSRVDHVAFITLAVEVVTFLQQISSSACRKRCDIPIADSYICQRVNSVNGSNDRFATVTSLKGIWVTGMIKGR